MHFESYNTYHIYNRSNETIFLTDDNYIYFLEKIKTFILPYSDILAWCLMPNHFHFLLQVKPEGCEYAKESNIKQLQVLSKQFAHVTSSYTQGFNKSNNRKGSLFAHKTKAKCLNEIAGKEDLGLICFNYIHENPVEANLCTSPKHWKHSSWLDYAGYRNGKLINKSLVSEMLNIDLDNFEKQNFAIINEKSINLLF